MGCQLADAGYAEVVNTDAAANVIEAMRARHDMAGVTWCAQLISNELICEVMFLLMSTQDLETYLACISNCGCCGQTGGFGITKQGPYACT